MTTSTTPQTLAPYLGGDFAHVWTPEQLVAIGVAHPPLFAPNAQAAYSNTDYVLLGLIIQAVTGRSLDAELSQRIFAPLKLRATSFATGQRIRGRHARGYLLTGPRTLQDVTAVSPTHAWATGNILSTADDVVRFYRALMSGRFLPPGLLRELKTLNDRIGLGLIQGETSCTVVGHNGEIAGYNALAYSTPNGRRQLVVLANSFTTETRVGTPKAHRAWDRLTETAACARRKPLKETTAEGPVQPRASHRYTTPGPRSALIQATGQRPRLGRLPACASAFAWWERRAKAYRSDEALLGLASRIGFRSEGA